MQASESSYLAVIADLERRLEAERTASERNAADVQRVRADAARDREALDTAWRAAREREQLHAHQQLYQAAELAQRNAEGAGAEALHKAHAAFAVEMQGLREALSAASRDRDARAAEAAAAQTAAVAASTEVARLTAELQRAAELEAGAQARAATAEAQATATVDALKSECNQAAASAAAALAGLKQEKARRAHESAAVIARLQGEHRDLCALKDAEAGRFQAGRTPP